MPTASITKKIPCSKKNLIDMVLDIEKYPEFVPWCLDGKIHTKVDKGNTVEITADLTIGKNFFKKTRNVRKNIIEAGQDTQKVDFGRGD